MMTLFKKELSYYFNNPIGYIVAVLFAIFANLLFIKDLFLRGESSMRPFFDLLPWLLLVFIPALTMRIFSEEKRTNTIEVLLTLPTIETEIVVAKFLALAVFSWLIFILTLSIPITLAIIGKPAVWEMIVSYFGALLLTASFISISLFFSSLTKNQIIAFLSSVLTIFFLIVLSGDFLVSFIPRFIQEAVSSLSPISHYESFLKGLIDVRSLFYFLSLMILFLFLTVVTIEKRE